MEKIWLKSYPEGVPAEIDPQRFSSLKHLIEECCEKYRDLPAYTNLGVTLNYAEIEESSRYFGAYLQKVVGLKKGDRVAIMMPNILQFPVVTFGILRAGLTGVTVNPLYSARELRHQLQDSGASAIVIMENFASTLEKVIEECPLQAVVTTRLGGMFPLIKSVLVNFVVKNVKKLVPKWNIPNTVRFNDALDKGAKHGLDEVELDHDDVAFLQYTGGTTGRSKGATLTHGNVVANVMQAGTWIQSAKEEGTEVIITALPLYHIFALTANCFVHMYYGAENVLITNPRDYPAFVRELKRTPFTTMTGINTLFNALLNTPGFDKIDFSHFKSCLSGGMSLQKAVADRWKKVTGVAITEAYGLSETSPAVTMNPPDLKEFNGSIGLPIPSTEVKICDDLGEELPIGAHGEICIRGPQLMAGYWNQPEETANVMSEDGWFRSGDIAYMDENGFVYISDRKKDMILVSGFNVYPNEIEDVVVTLEGVVEAAAIGVPDSKSGEVVKLFVVKKDPSVSERRVIAHCRKNLAGYKVPKIVEFREELPKTNVGKILRRALREH